MWHLRQWRRLPAQNTAERLAIDIAAAQDQRYPLATHTIALLDESGEGRRPGSLGDVVRGCPEEADRFRNLILLDLNDAGGTLGDECQRIGMGLAAGHAVCEGVRRVGGD